MKKLAAIFLIALFVFNVVGYKLVFYYQQKQSDTHLEAMLDNNNYDEADLISIKVPLQLPYQPDWSSFERVDGEISFNGKIYKYVKRRIFEGQLELLCLPDYSKMSLESAANDISKNSNDINLTSGAKKPLNSKSTSAKNTSGEYNTSTFYSTSAIVGAKLSLSPIWPVIKFLSLPRVTPWQPPEV